MAHQSWLVDLLDALNHMRDMSDSLLTALQSEQLLATTFPHTTPLSSQFFQQTSQPVAQLRMLLNQWIFLNHQPGRETLLLPGVFAVSEHTLQKVALLNVSKEQVKQTVLAIKKLNMNRHHKETLREELEKHFFDHLRHDALATNLRQSGLARLHLKQLYRPLHILLECPLRLSWTWAQQTRAISHISVADAEKRLSQLKNKTSIDIQKKRLAELPSDEQLALVQILAPHLRLNINFSDKRWMTKGALPVFYQQAKEHLPLPYIQPPQERPDRMPVIKRRADCQLEEEPFLPAIRVYRYRKKDL